MKTSRRRRLRQSAAFATRCSAAAGVIGTCVGGAVVVEEAFDKGHSTIKKQEIKDFAALGTVTVLMLGAAVGFGHYRGSR